MPHQGAGETGSTPVCGSMTEIRAVRSKAATHRKGSRALNSATSSMRGECWEQPERRYDPRPGYEYDYSVPYRGYQRPRRPTKWERKGFCPPGQHKKGNC
jgi:hypothetical protein